MGLFDGTNLEQPVTCDRCGNPRLLPWMAATIRDGREKVCTPCFLDNVREAR